jgi:hypothetical protein
LEDDEIGSARGRKMRPSRQFGTTKSTITASAMRTRPPAAYRRQRKKGPAKIARPPENAAVTAAFAPQVRSALGRFLATSGFGASGPRILKLMRPQTSSPQIAFLTPDLVVEPDL